MLPLAPAPRSRRAQLELVLRTVQTQDEVLQNVATHNDIGPARGDRFDSLYGRLGELDVDSIHDDLPQVSCKAGRSRYAYRCDIEAFNQRVGHTADVGSRGQLSR